MSQQPQQQQQQQQKKLDSILYVGEDVRYWSQVQDRIKDLSKGKTFDFQSELILNFRDFEWFILKVIKIAPKVIYLDFTTNPNFVLKLGRVLRRLTPTKGITIIGIFDQNADVALLKEAGIAGIYINHIKGIEIHDIAFDALVLMFPKENIKCQFASANRKQDIEMRELVRIGYITVDYLHAEGNPLLEDNEYLTIDTKIFERFIFSKSYQVKVKGQNGLFYDFDNFYHFAYSYLEPLPPPAEGEPPEVNKAKEKQRNLEIQEMKQRQIDWINVNIGKVLPATKFFIIDKEMRTLDLLEKEKAKLTSPISTRVQMYLDQEIEKEVAHFLPHVIVYYFDRQLTISQEKIDKMEKEELDAYAQVYNTLTKNDETALGTLVEAIKKIPNYNPVLIIFSNRSDHKSNLLQSKYGYSRIIQYNGDLSFEQIMKLDESYRKLSTAEEEKILKAKLDQLKISEPRKYKFAKPEQLREKIVYLDNHDANSFAFIVSRVTILAISETEVVIESIKQLKLYSIYQMNVPAEISFTPIMEKKGRTSYGYRCLFHSYNEKGKTTLRQFINDIFLEAKRKERAKEAAEFEKMNKKAKEAREESTKESSDDSEKKAS
ncbi:MAG: hypothetical protein HQK49_16710 [Oligoflexia bacterium]|nr:hypothetical protein [Oligoflexia bacterium]